MYSIRVILFRKREGVTRAKRALLYLLLRLGLRNVSTRIFNKQDIYVTSCLIKESLFSSYCCLSQVFHELSGFVLNKVIKSHVKLHVESDAQKANRPFAR